MKLEKLTELVTVSLKHAGIPRKFYIETSDILDNSVVDNLQHVQPLLAFGKHNQNK